MVTKYNTGQTVLIPAVIEAARTANGQVIYDVSAHTWEGIPEDEIIVDNRAISARAVQEFKEALAPKERW